MLEVRTPRKLSHAGEMDLAISALEAFLDEEVAHPGILLTLIDLTAAIGSQDKCKDFTQRLTTVIDATENVEFAPISHCFLRIFEEEIPGSLPELQRLEKLSSENEDLINRSTLHFEERKIYKYDLASELVLAQRLFKSRMLSDDDYKTVIYDLCNYSSFMGESPSTVVHILNDRGLSSYEKCMEFISEDSSLPTVSLKCFELHKEAFSLLHMEFMKYRAALVFDVMEGEALVAILNPYNTRLKSDVSMLTNTRCHFYLVKAEDYDLAVDSVRRAYLKESGVF